MNKQRWRRTWFQVHKWIGLLLAALIIPISLTGAVLVWHEELEPLVSPERFAVSGETTLAPGTYVAAARAALKPGDTRLLLSPNSDFFRFFADPSGRPRSGNGGPTSTGATGSAGASPAPAQPGTPARP